MYDAFTPKIVDGAPSIKVEQKDIENQEDDIVTFTGVYPGYTKTQLTLYNKIGADDKSYFDFWTTSEFFGYGCKFGITIDKELKIGGFGISKLEDKTKKYWVRPVLAK